MKFYIYIVLITLSGCSTLDDLQKPAKNLEFTLEKDVLSFYTAGVFDYRQARGLLKGNYKIIAEDKDGYYFMPVDGKIVKLSGEIAAKFENTTNFPKDKKFELANGGLWIPKGKDGKSFDFFQILGPDYDSIMKDGGGVIHAGVAKMLEGGIIFWGEQHLPDLSSLQLVEVKEDNQPPALTNITSN